jgi:hypothetical protein
MKKSLFASLALVCGLSAFAQLNGDGYYRLQNYMSTRYAYVVNDKGKINVATTSADLTSIALWSDESKALADPSTVIYIKNVGSNKYNLIAQGTSMYDIISHYLQIKDNGDGTYKAYAEQSGMVIYIGDAEQSEYGKGTLATNTKDRWRDWYIKPVDNGENSYLGVNPDIEANGKFYKSYYASFPFSILSSGVKAYYITKVSDTEAAYKQITSDKVPAATPLFFECTSSKLADNRLQPLDETVASISDNILTGVYFDFASGSNEKRNQVTYNAKTMRVLGVMSDGSLGLVTATNITTIPANTFYVTVPETAAAEIKLVTEEEFGKNDNNETPGDNNTPGNDDNNTGNGGDDNNTGNGGDDNNTGNGGDDNNTGNGGDDNNTGNGGDDNNTGNGGDDNNTGNGGDDNNTGNGGDDNNTGNGGDDNNTEEPDEPSNGVVSIATDTNATFDIYTATGVLVKRNATTTEGLAAGIYIAKGRKIVVLP